MPGRGGRRTREGRVGAQTGEEEEEEEEEEGVNALIPEPQTLNTAYPGDETLFADMVHPKP